MEPRISKNPQELPVSQRKAHLLKLLRDNQAIVVVGETGSGKTTQIPQWCVQYFQSKGEHGKRVACTQPRRIAAMSVAARVAQEMKVKLGNEVGYSVRFEACSSPKTRLLYLTDGMLLREAILDPMLSSYGIVIVDEAHERTLQTEILLAVIVRAMKSRNESDSNPLKVIIMSATLDTKSFMQLLKPALLVIEGRQHPVQDMFAETPQSDLLTSILITVFQIHRTEGEGDILVFCSGQDEIHSLLMLCKKVLKQAPESLQNLVYLPLYAALPANSQMKVFDTSNASLPNIESIALTKPPFVRRVIFSTNVAETSITIPNIKFVVDSGKVKCRTYCPKTKLESLKVTTISKSQAKQRSGRAGRVCAGTCYRLYTSDDYDKMPDYPVPEIKRSSLDSVLLQIISMGIKNVYSLKYFERPEPERLKTALANLQMLKAIKVSPRVEEKSQQQNGKATKHDENHIKRPKEMLIDDNLLSLDYELTKIGKRLSAFPLSPSLARVILAGDELGCLEEILTIVSLISIENLFHIPPHKQAQADLMLEKFKSNEGDTIMMLRVYKSFKLTYNLNRAGLKQWCLDHFINTKNFKMARLIRKQLSDLCKSLGMTSSSCGQDTSLARQALTYGLFNNVATMWNGKYRSRSVNDIHIHPNSCLFKSRPESILYLELVETNKCYMRTCTLTNMNWIRDVSLERMHNGDTPAKG